MNQNCIMYDRILYLNTLMLKLAHLLPTVFLFEQNQKNGPKLMITMDVLLIRYHTPMVMKTYLLILYLQR